MIRPILFRLGWLALLALGLSSLTALPGCDKLVTEYDSIVVYDSNFGQSCVGNCHGDEANILQVPRGQYENSAHSSAKYIERVVSLNGEDYLTSSAECAYCHSHSGYVDYIGGNTSAQERPSVINCYTCHLPHTGQFENWSLDSLRGHQATVSLGIRGDFDMGKSNMCAHCHQIPAGSGAPPPGYQEEILTGDWGPHYSPQADLVAGKAGARFGGVVTDTITHLGIEDNLNSDGKDGCIACHYGYNGSGIAGGIGAGYDFGEHTFRLEDSNGVQYHETCNASCHIGEKEITGFYTDSTIMTLDSLASLIRDSLWNRNYLSHTDSSGRSFTAGDTLPSATAEILYNYLLYRLDGSRGIHNPLLMRDLLSVSARKLDSIAPTAAFSIADSTDTFVCAETGFFTLTNETQGNATGYSWILEYEHDSVPDFSSSNEHLTHVLTIPGVYSVSLVAKGYLGNDTLIVPNMILVGDTLIPEIEASDSTLCLAAEGTDSIEVILTSPTQWAKDFIWYFGDGESDSTDSNSISHWYKTLGYHDVELHISNRCDTDTLTVDSLIYIGKTPQVAFTASDSSGCDSLTVDFTSTVPAGDDWSYRWYFGPGIDDTSSLKNPTHTYSSPNNYSVSLAISSPTCGEDSVEVDDFIIVSDSNNVTEAIFTVDSTTASVSHEFVFTNNSYFITYWIWDFGDGSPASTAYEPTHTYSTDGVYTVELVVGNACRSDTATTVITVVPDP